MIPALEYDSESSSSTPDDIRDEDWTEEQNEDHADNVKKSYSCGICHKTFKYKSPLEIHMRVHTGEKPYECKYCGKKFAQIGYCKVHERTHTGEKPYECAVCIKKFTRSTLLRKHLRRHSECALEVSTDNKVDRKNRDKNNDRTHNEEVLMGKFCSEEE